MPSKSENRSELEDARMSHRGYKANLTRTFRNLSAVFETVREVPVATIRPTTLEAVEDHLRTYKAAADKYSTSLTLLYSLQDAGIEAEEMILEEKEDLVREMATVIFSVRQAPFTLPSGHAMGSNSVKINSALKPEKLMASCTLAEFRSWNKGFNLYYSSNKMDRFPIAEQHGYLRSCLELKLQQLLSIKTQDGTVIEGPDGCEPEGADVCAMLLTAFSLVLVLVTLPFSLCVSVKVVQEYERAVVFRLGRLRSGGAEGPGLFFVMPCVDTYKKVDLRTVSFDVPPQEVLSRDSVTVSVDAVVYYRVSNPTMATNNIEDYSHSTRLLAATTLRNVLGTKNLAEILSERETISQVMQNSLDEATDPWGVKAERVEIKDVRLPVQLQRAMAAEAEAAREARAKVIAAVGEQKASKALREAASVIADSPSALQLRYLQTLNSIAAEHNSTIIFPMPLNFVNQFLGRKS
eukprot:maker-scaffold21_size687808-snap-gene-4.8 protein:Tk09837 transcript:maker-scaffold21_size687808-snap-gene-4.8-mRNA-1 annotation:"band 7 protein cg42540-like"